MSVKVSFSLSLRMLIEHRKNDISWIMSIIIIAFYILVSISSLHTHYYLVNILVYLVMNRDNNNRT